MVVMRPIRNRTQSGAGSEHIRLGEHGHQSDKAAIAAAVNTDAFCIDAVFLHQTVAPSRALNLTGRGSIQSLRKNSGIGEVVTGLTARAVFSSIGWFGKR